MEREPTPKAPAGADLSAAERWYHFQRYPFLLAKILLWAVVGYVGFSVLSQVENVLFPVLASLLLAYLLDPTIDWFEERGVGRTVGIGIVLAAAATLMALFALVLYPTIAGQTAKVVEKLPALVSLVEDSFLPWLEQRVGVEVPVSATAAMAEYGDTIREQLPGVANRASTWVAGLLTRSGSLIASLLNLVMIPVFTFYFLRDFDKMRLSLVDYIPRKSREVWIERLVRSDEVVGAWFRGQIEVACILGVCYGLGFGILFGAVGIGALGGAAIGVLTGLLNIIPYFGMFIGVVLSTLVLLIDWHGVGPLVGLAVVVFVVQLLEGYVITPKIVGEKVGLSPVTVIIVLLVGGEAMGLIGVLLAIPVAGVVRVLLPDLLAYYQTTPFYTGEVSEPAPSRHGEDARPPARVEEPSPATDADAQAASSSAPGERGEQTPLPAADAATEAEPGPTEAEPGRDGPPGSPGDDPIDDGDGVA